MKNIRYLTGKGSRRMVVAALTTVAAAVCCGARAANVDPDLPDHYQTLNVPKTASATQLKRAHRRLTLKYNLVRGLFQRSALRRRFEIDTAYHFLKDPELRAKYDLLTDDQLTSLIKYSVFAKLAEDDFAAKFDSPSQIQALQIAVGILGEDAVTGHYDELVDFRTPEQVSALLMLVNLEGMTIGPRYREILRFTNRHQLDALKMAITRFADVVPTHLSDLSLFETRESTVALDLIYRNFGPALGPLLKDVARIDSPARLNHLNHRLAEGELPVPQIVHAVASVCESDL